MRNTVRRVFWIGLLGIAVTVATAQLPKDWIFTEPPVGELCQRAWQQPPVRSAWIEPKNYDVLRYELFLDWRNPLGSTTVLPEDRRYNGVNRMLITAAADTVTSIAIDAGEMVIDSVFIDGVRYPDPVEITDEQFTLDLSAVDKVLHRGDTAAVWIFYHTTGAPNQSFFLFPKGMFVGIRNGDTVRVEERLAYTMSEPEGAHFWFPCNDVPSDKALAEIAIRVPEGFLTASNGLVVDTIDHADGSRTFVWVHQYPIPPYLMVANASKFFFWSEWYHRVSNPDDSLEIQYYVWRPDYEGTAAGDYNAPFAFRNVRAMMRAFEERLGDYPFEKYGMVAVQPYFYGGMEHQTMTTINRVWLRGQDPGIAHELAHQWFGDKVTCKTWADLWLNEGGATYGEALWEEAQNGWEGYHQRLMRHRSAYLQGNNSIPIYNPPPQALFNYATTYAKAGWIYHMLRQLVGDSAFYQAIHWYLTKHAYGNAATDDFRQAFEDVITDPPVDFATFFDQWVYQAGHPQYAVTVSLSEDRTKADVTVRQVQVGMRVPEVFVMPLEIQFQSAAGDKIIKKVLNNQKVQTFSFTLPFAVNDVELDPQDKILCEKQVVTEVAAVEESARRPTIQYFPHLQQLVLANVPVGTGSAQLRLYDLAGRMLWQHQQRFSSSSATVALPFRLQPGWYGCEVQWRNGRVSIPFVVKP